MPHIFYQKPACTHSEQLYTYAYDVYRFVWTLIRWKSRVEAEGGFDVDEGKTSWPYSLLAG
ncbi:hypothetical protein BBL520_03420 [Bifidobacterium breve]|nr:hypothetical protein BBL520_03420 [Bifidobacterium breve]